LQVLTLRAYAKVNLTLEVLGRRTDGYHEVRTVMQSISLADTLTLRPSPDLTLSCDDPALAGESNLALKAARLLRDAAQAPHGAHLTLEKGIPVAAGLGGGSADAAAALAGLNLLWGLNWPVERLHPLAAALGSDVPFFLHGGTALASGRGEVLEPLASSDVRWFVLLVPPADGPNKTTRLYGALSPDDYRDGSASQTVAETLRAGLPLADGLLVNSFAEAARGFFPDLARYEAAFSRAVDGVVHLSGAGPALFRLLETEERGREIVDRLRVAGYAPYLAHTVGQGWEAVGG
jgi:4-diphosphocytidyl-2-C-methyl-D-erythritol kinase